MKFSYYPGCTLKTQAKGLEETARLSAELLGVELEELPEWQCCGAVYPMSKEEIAVRLSSVRALMAARDEGRPLLTLCSACHHVIKRVNHDMSVNEEVRRKANGYLQPEEPYAGETRVVHYLEMLRDAVGFGEVERKVTSPLTGVKVAAYYGCLLLRPSEEMQFDNPENPSIMEEFISAIGASPVRFPYRNECCGGYLALEDRPVACRTSCRVTRSACLNGAEAVITACPLCLYNLKENGGGEVPVYYFTELLAAALGLKALEGGLAHAS